MRIPRLAFFLVLTSSPPVLLAGDSFLFEFTERHMGAEFELSIYAWNQFHAEEAGREAFKRAGELEGIFSPQMPDSELSRLNRSRPGIWVSLSDELFTVLDAALKIAEISDGAYDPTRKHAGGDARGPGWKDLQLKRRERRVLFARPGMSLDLGDPALGYIGDEVMGVLRGKFVKAALFQAGEDIVALGEPPDSAGWRVDILGGQRDGESLALLRDQALSACGKVRVLAPRGLMAGILAQAAVQMGTRKAKTVVPLFRGCRLWDPDRDEINWWSRVSGKLPVARAALWSWALGLALTYAAWVSRHRRNLIRDLPLSRPRSVAMGLAEVVGKAASLGESLPGQAGGVSCVWSKTLRTRNAGTDEQTSESTWVEEVRRPFRLVDGNGSVLVDPRGARIYGNKVRDETFDFNRLRVWTIEEGQDVYVLGEAVPAPPRGPGRAEMVRRLLKFWTQTPALREKIDLNADGILQPEEWDRARAHAEDHVTLESLSASEGGAETTLRAPRGGFFIISTRGEKNALALQGWPWLRALSGLACAAAGFALWPEEFTELIAHRPLRAMAEAWPVLAVLFLYRLHVRGYFHQLSGSAFAEYHG